MLVTTPDNQQGNFYILIFFTYSTRHDACVPLERRQIAALNKPDTNGKANPSSWDVLKNDFITRDRLFVKQVEKEAEAAKTWKDNWGFLADYDAKVGDEILFSVNQAC